MNMRLSGSPRVDSTNVLPSGELCGLTKLIKIPEYVRKYAAEQGIAEEAALAKGMAEKSKEFATQGAKVYP
jgi:hypothetical protein